MVQINEEVLRDLPTKDKEVIREALKSLTSEEGIKESEIKIVPVSLIPIRLQHIFRELGKEGYIVKESLVLNGKLFLLAIKKGKKLDIAPDFETKF